MANDIKNVTGFKAPLPPNENKNSGTFGNADDSKETPPAPPKPEVTPEAAATIEKETADAVKRAKEAAEANAAREVAAQVANQGTGFAVAPGLSITTRRGVVDAGASISEIDFAGGKVDFDDLVSRGAIVRL